MRYLFTVFFSTFLTFIGFSQSADYINYLSADSLYKAREFKPAYELLVPLLEKERNDSLRIEIRLRIGYILAEADKLDSSLYYLKSAVSDCIEYKIYYRLSRTYFGIGNQFVQKRDFPQAHIFFTKALEAATSAKDSTGTYVGLTVLYLMQKKYDSAYLLVQERLSKFQSGTVPYNQFYINQAKGNYFLSKGIYDSALIFLRIAAGKTEDPRLKANVFSDLARVYTLLGNYPFAIVYQDSAYDINSKKKLGENFLSYFDTYVQLYRQKGDYKIALAYADSARTLSDSLFDAERNKAAIDADAKYDNQKALADKAIAEKESSINQRNLVITLFGLGFVALVAFLSLRISRARKKSNTILTLQKKQVQQLADELSVANETKARLFSTIGHDLRGPVSSLYALLKLEELKGASKNDEMSGHTVQLLDTLEELLTWSKSQMEGFVLQPVKINSKQLFEELIQFYAPAAQSKNISFRNESAVLILKTDENILKAILRNVISNAVAHTSPGNTIQFSAEPGASGKTVLSVKNPCTQESFQRFKMNFDGSEIKSNAHGFGIVLIKEFAQKMHAEISLTYANGHAVLSILL